MESPKIKGRPSLVSKSDIVKAALEMGLHKASMHSIGKALGVSATALYRHVGSRDELISTCCDYIVGKVEIPKQQDWEAYLYSFGRNFRSVLLSNPSSVEFVRNNQNFTHTNNILFNHALEVLSKSKFEITVGFMAFSTVYRKVIDLVQYQEQYNGTAHQSVQSINIEALPYLAQLFSEIKPINFDEYFEDSLKLTIEGIKAVYR